jgi:peptidoglycan/xylan/chitin deacetylase (PgdA/CDA1 family)
LRHPIARRAVVGLGGAAGRDLVLVYHRVGRGDGLGDGLGIVPEISAATLRHHIAALRKLGEIVALDDIVNGAGQRHRPRFALTFDDDYASHVELALPVLQELGVTATFFLSGRRLHGLGRYWWEVLEDRWRRRDGAAVAHTLGLPEGPPDQIALACERDFAFQELLEGQDDGPGDHLDIDGIQALVAAGMGVGFHTLHHQVLTALHDSALSRALQLGRTAVESAAGTSLRLLAYPHGKADGRVASAASAAGYAAAFTGAPVAVGRQSDIHLLGRWEPGPVTGAEVVSGAGFRLIKPTLG